MIWPPFIDPTKDLIGTILLVGLMLTEATEAVLSGGGSSEAEGTYQTENRC